MSNRTAVGAVSQWAWFTLLDPQQPTYRPRVKTELSWSPRCPHRVTVTFHRHGHTVEWSFARDLLAAGVDGPAGWGDVAVMPDFRDWRRVELILDSPAGRVGFRVLRTVLTQFLAATALPGPVDAWPGLDAWLRAVA
jgi:Streptomyces sporulation and cell division protein, SsgA